MSGRKKDIHYLLSKARQSSESIDTSEAKPTGGHIRGSIRLPGVEVREQKGKTVYRWEESESGGNFSANPIAVYINRATQAYVASINSALKIGRLVEGRFKGTKTNQKRKELLVAEVLRLWTQHRDKGSGCAGLIARKLGITARRVRQIIKEEITENA